MKLGTPMTISSPLQSLFRSEHFFFFFFFLPAIYFMRLLCPPISHEVHMAICQNESMKKSLSLPPMLFRV